MARKKKKDDERKPLKNAVEKAMEKAAEPETPEAADAKEAPSPETIEAWKAQAAKAEEYLDLARRTKADFINYQERVERDRDSVRRYAVEGFIREFLGALDAVSESVRAARSGASGDQVVAGVELIEKEFLRILSGQGVERMETEGKPFDPAYHEAAAMEVSEEADPNTVIGEVRQGWMLHDRVLRPAMVRVAQAPPEEN